MITVHGTGRQSTCLERRTSPQIGDAVLIVPQKLECHFWPKWALASTNMKINRLSYVLFVLKHAFSIICNAIFMRPWFKAYNFAFFFFFPRGRFPSLPRDFIVYTVTFTVLRVFHCERCQIRTRDHCLSSLEHCQ